MNIHVDHTNTLCDERVDIKISELSPYETVKISASMVLPWAQAEKYESYAYFMADENGKINVSQQKPDVGTYSFVDGMGLFSSMQKVSSKGANIASGINVDKSIFVELVAECRQENTCVIIERCFHAPGIQRLTITDEFIGELFYNENACHKTIIVLGGSDGNLAAVSTIASLLASHGFNALAVGYFNGKGLPNKLGEIPLEYFEKVFDWLKKNSITHADEIFIHGTSKGGELALLLASRYPCITRVVANAPHSYCFQALNGKRVSSWSYGGQSLPFINISNWSVYAEMVNCFIKNKPFGYTSCYRKSVQTAKNQEDARIKIENAKADLLLIAGQKDNIWNTYEGCMSIIETLEKNDYPYYYTLLAYKQAGHLFPYPYTIPLCETTGKKLSPRLLFSGGGTFEGNAKAQADSWEKTVAFFKR